MTQLHDLVERVDRLVLRHEELKRTSQLMEQQLQAVSAERDSLKSRLAAARARIDALSLQHQDRRSGRAGRGRDDGRLGVV